MKKKLFCLALASAIILLGFSGCRGRDDIDDPDRFENVFILYSAGKNSLSSYLKKNIKELKKGYVPLKGSDNVCIIVTHDFAEGGDATVDSSPYIIRMYTDRDTENVVMDTLKTLPIGTMLTKAGDLKSILEYIGTNFKAEKYGMVFSSHGSGWLPKGYYAAPEKYDKVSSGTGRQSLPDFSLHSPYVTYDAASIPVNPLVKSLGQEYNQRGKVITSYELNIEEFAEALPFPMEYIIMDACLMGGIETAYSLRNKCHYLAFSPAEILTAGFDYNNMGSRLMEGKNPDIQRVCEDFYNKYKDESGSRCTATVSLVDCTNLGYLTEICKNLNEKHRDGLNSINLSSVQPFAQKDKNWFYDLEDIYIKAGCTRTEISELLEAIDGCVLYKATTKRILDKIDVNCYCGLSMFIPRGGSNYLKEFYKTLSWNEATALVN